MSSVIFDLGSVFLIKMREQLFEQGIYINHIQDTFWEQFQPELQKNLKAFPFHESMEKDHIERHQRCIKLRFYRITVSIPT